MVETPKREDRPLALTASLWLGALGGALILVGIVAGVEALVVSGVGAGTLSLISVLIWRSQLIDAWRRARDREGGHDDLA